MRVLASRASVAAGTVSLRVANIGALTHELVILPLAPGLSPAAARWVPVAPSVRRQPR